MVEADIHKADVSLVGVVWCGVVGFPTWGLGLVHLIFNSCFDEFPLSQ